MTEIQYLENEIEILRNEVKLKDSLIQKYEEIIYSVGGKIQTFEEELPEFRLSHFGINTTRLTTKIIEFPKYQFAYKSDVREVLNKLYKNKER